MNPTLTSRTSQGMSLANALYEALDDFWRAFGRPPSLILIPGFRRAEIESCMGSYDYTDSAGCPTLDKFAGIPFRFTGGEVIELQ